MKVIDHDDDARSFASFSLLLFVGKFLFRSQFVCNE